MWIGVWWLLDTGCGEVSVGWIILGMRKAVLKILGIWIGVWCLSRPVILLVELYGPVINLYLFSHAGME